MKTFHTVKELRDTLYQDRLKEKHIAFVPTMGNLHEGHMDLIRRARQESEIVVASIFVNPMQFGKNEDLERYPRTLKDDQTLLESNGCDYLFAPDALEMYPDGKRSQTQIEVTGLSDILCGASRPGHFIGVATVVTKLFNIVQPDCAIFGNKDYQQLKVIEDMTRDLSSNINIIGVDIARSESGLALSSRNGYLSQEERDIATNLYATLKWAKDQLMIGSTSHEEIREQAQQKLEAVGFQRDYFEIRAQDSLQTPLEEERSLVILAAAYLGKARLIDNITVELT
ncbi:pantoate--beta-alanine ligase [Marinomonas mediterranea]|jgi:pantothenate synthetase (EC 6.3.2.1)|uniref:Pantothenate synthetase n=1 Tax=Marinomonas mediterranea (strain ATCC 700492 / JCM 21426 / NBRC 103028 / MMB-1) TaxID=717774 RepID=F2JV65_MARM1|nr:pantoate--beta-alanine ligase [Marinomonas mediterranea]ADZ92823.1 Pantothenate synthetase [Marinomonas mediterranea MMB-1]WCN10756.1 pantoate--beta-alanine ligase [Marinomonas mediterranea]WCN14813.1 pantoate--beta-alanine ligase [Marinomonas mediterranea]WCN18846.1 pantoate--beta-alanine ligase [Marinomonas mediterranea MMB-1]